MYIDGDFDSGIGNCEHHCCPTCHPAQVEKHWVYGCRHMAWYQNKMGDFVPIVKCGGDKSKCELKSNKDYKYYINGIKRRINNAEKKIEGWKKTLNELEVEGVKCE